MGGNGQASVGVAGKDLLVVGMSDAPFPSSHRSVFVLDDDGQEVFAAGIDLNGVRYIKLLGKDGNAIWEVSDQDKEPR